MLATQEVGRCCTTSELQWMCNMHASAKHDFETQRRHHQKSKTWVWPLQNFFKKNWWCYFQRDLQHLYGNVILIRDHLNVTILQRDQSHHHAEEAIIQRLRKLRIAYLGNVACSLYVLPGKELELPGKEEVFPCVAHTQPNNYFITRGSNRATRNYRDYVTLRFTQDVLREISTVLNEMSN